MPRKILNVILMGKYLFKSLVSKNYHISLPIRVEKNIKSIINEIFYAILVFITSYCAN